MKIKYFTDTDTLYIELRPADITDTRDLDEDTLLDLDASGQVCAITLEHAYPGSHAPAWEPRPGRSSVHLVSHANVAPACLPACETCRQGCRRYVKGLS